MADNNVLNGKKLLLLGTNTATCDMVKYAQSQGVYVFVTDNLPPEKSAAKLIADETWNISTADVDSLERMVRTNDVDGVFAGVSEFNLEKALTLCERLNLPFYASRALWNISTDKKRFKKMFQDQGIQVPEEFYIDHRFKHVDLSRIEYPVIVKPIGSSGSRGISICRNESELRTAYKKAMSVSERNEILVEKFVPGDEVGIEYTLKDGDMSLSCMLDKYLNYEVAPMPVKEFSIYPSKHLDSYINDNVNEMVKSAYLCNGFKNGVLFIQGKVTEKGFVFFEMGYRIRGGALYSLISRFNRINYMEMLVNYSLTGRMLGYDLTLDDPYFKKYYSQVTLNARQGVVGKIEGLDKIKRMVNVINITQFYDIGDRITAPDGTLRQGIVRPEIIAESKEELIEIIKDIENTLKVYDDRGLNMLHKRMDKSGLKLR